MCICEVHDDLGSWVRCLMAVVILAPVLPFMCDLRWIFFYFLIVSMWVL